jgi:hypothetical protein
MLPGGSIGPKYVVQLSLREQSQHNITSYPTTTEAGVKKQRFDIFRI